jgi:hypothetical protein
MPYTVTERLRILGRRINRTLMSMTSVLPWRTTLPPADVDPPEAHNPPPGDEHADERHASGDPPRHDQQHVDAANRHEHGHPKR